jgi:hypothetical protein
LASAICFCRAGERFSSENRFNGFLSSGWAGFHLGENISPLIHGIRLVQRTGPAGVCCVSGCSSAEAGLGRKLFTLLCRENLGGAYGAPVQGSNPHTAVFGWDATRLTGRSLQPGPVNDNHDTRGHHAEGSGNLREGDLADEGESGSLPNN